MARLGRTNQPVALHRRRAQPHAKAFCALAYIQENPFLLLYLLSMNTFPTAPAAIAQPTPQDLALSGSWTARGIGGIQQQLATVRVAPSTAAVADGARIDALDTAGA